MSSSSPSCSRSSLLLCLALLACLPASPMLAQEADPPSEPAGPVLEGVYTVTGTLAVKGVRSHEKVRHDLGRYTLMGEIQMPPLPLPEGYESWDAERQQEWNREFRQSLAGKTYFRKRREAIARRLKFAFSPDEDGVFEITGVPPGKYRMIGQVRAVVSEAGQPRRTPVIASLGQEIEVGDGDLDLGFVVVSRHPVPGGPAPDFEFETLDGEKKRLKDLRGKIVLLDFWATWCIPCLRETPELMKTHRDFAGERFEILGLSVDRSAEPARDYVEEHELGWIQAYLGEWSESEVARRYGVKSLPSIWLVDARGQVVETGLRGAKIYSAVEKAVAAMIEEERRKEGR